MKDIFDLSNGEFSQSRLSCYETGKRQLSVDAAIRLSNIVGATPAELLNISDKKAHIVVNTV